MNDKGRYSMWCGGPMIHPAIGGMLLTPISPRGIARPALLPEDAVLRLSVAPTGRATASVFYLPSFSLFLSLFLSLSLSLPS